MQGSLMKIAALQTLTFWCNRHHVHAISLNFPQNQLVVIAFIITLYY